MWKKIKNKTFLLNVNIVFLKKAPDIFIKWENDFSKTRSILDIEVFILYNEKILE